MVQAMQGGKITPKEYMREEGWWSGREGLMGGGKVNSYFLFR